jgi:hypothetical protein
MLNVCHVQRKLIIADNTIEMTKREPISKMIDGQAEAWRANAVIAFLSLMAFLLICGISLKQQEAGRRKR